MLVRDDRRKIPISKYVTIVILVEERCFVVQTFSHRSAASIWDSGRLR
jgi:hypothetical protein